MLFVLYISNCKFICIRPTNPFRVKFIPILPFVIEIVVHTCIGEIGIAVQFRLSLTKDTFNETKILLITCITCEHVPNQCRLLTGYPKYRVLFWLISFRYTIFLHLENRNNTGTYILPTCSKWWTTELEKILHRIWKKKDLEDYKNDANRARYWSNSCCIMFYYIKVRKPDMSWVLMINSQKHLKTWKYNYRNQLKYLLRITIYYSQ